MSTAAEPTTELVPHLLTDQLRDLAKERANLATLDAALKEARDAYREIFAPVIAEQKQVATRVAELEASVRTLTLSTYEATKEKKPAPGVEVKVFKVPSILNEDEALAWSKKTGMALIPETFDRDALIKIAAASPLPFVLFSEEPRATIAKTLDPAAYAAPAAEPATEAV